MTGREGFVRSLVYWLAGSCSLSGLPIIVHSRVRIITRTTHAYPELTVPSLVAASRLCQLVKQERYLSANP